MSTTIKVKKETRDALKTYLKEPYNFASMDEAIRFLMKKEELFELMLNHDPKLLKLVQQIQREEEIKRLEEKLQALKENRPPRVTTIFKIHITDLEDLWGERKLEAWKDNKNRTYENYEDRVTANNHDWENQNKNRNRKTLIKIRKR